MKKNLLLAITGVLLLGACEMDPGSESYPPTEPEEMLGTVSFVKSAETCEMQNGDAPLEIEVTATKISAVSRTFGVQVVADATTATADAYELPAATVVIPAGARSSKFIVKPVYKNLTPEAVTLTLKLNADAALLGSNAQTVVSLKRYYKLDMAFLTQTWAAQNRVKGELVSGTYGEAYEVTISEGVGGKVLITNLFSDTNGKQIEAVVDFEKSQLQILSGQLIHTHSTWGDLHIYHPGPTADSGKPIICDISYKGIAVGAYDVTAGVQPRFSDVTTTLSEKE